MKGKKRIAIFMAAVMLSQVLSWSSASQNVFAADAMVVKTHVKTQDNTDIGTYSIKNPQGLGKWSYVWFGKYQGNPVLYRVLSRSTQGYNTADQTKAGRRTMFLDCDSVLASFRMANEVTPDFWNHSYVKRILNETEFGPTWDYPDGFFAEGNLTAYENKAIATSTRDLSASNIDKESFGSPATGYTPLSGERVFVLDAREAGRVDYGYPNNAAKTSSREKLLIGTTDSSNWWLRNTAENDPSLGIDSFTGNVGCVLGYHDKPYNSDQKGLRTGEIAARDCDDNQIGISPALNLDLANVILSSKLDKSNDDKDVYKLTLKDEDLGVKTTGAITREGEKVTIPLKVTGTGNHFLNADNLSVVITRKPWDSATGWGEGNELLQYTMLDQTAAAVMDAKSGSFVLDTDEVTGACGKDYYAYLIVEDKNDIQECDYASEPLEVMIPEEGDDPVDPLSYVRLRTYNLVLQKNTKRTIKASFVGPGKIQSAVAADKLVTVTHDDKSITVKAGKKTGDTTIKVTAVSTAKGDSRTFEKTVKVKVQDGKVITKTLSLSHETIKVYTNKVPKLVKVKAYPDAVSTKQKVKLKFKSGKKKVKATYDAETGYISLLGQKAGKAEIEVSAGTKKKKLIVNVKEHDIVLNTYDLVIQKKNDKVITAKIFADSIESAEAGDSKLIKTSFDDNHIYVTAKHKTGSTNIKVKTKSGIEKTVKVTVQSGKVVTKSLTLTPSSTQFKMSLTGKNNKKKVTIKVKAAPDVVSTDQPVSISIGEDSAKRISVVYNERNKKLTVTAKKKGIAGFTLEAGRQKKKFKITVNA